MSAGKLAYWLKHSEYKVIVTNLIYKIKIQVVIKTGCPLIQQTVLNHKGKL